MNYFRYAKKDTLIEEIVKANRKRRASPSKESTFELENFTVERTYSIIRSKASGRTVGVIEDKMIYLIGERVELKADGDGYIAPNITKEGKGVITRVRLNGTVRYGVQMDNGEFGYVTSRYIWKKLS